MQLSHVYALNPVYHHHHWDHGPPSGCINKSKKRKRSLTPSEPDESDDADLGDDEEEDDEDGQKPASEAGADSAVSSLPASTRDKAERYRVAGLAPDDNIPPRPFPAADFPLSKTNVLEDATKQLLEMRPPLYNALSYSTMAGKEREKHLGVVNTIMHQMLLKGDYQRAGRAWGMILRASYTGTDLRRLGRWGIGAEILLRSGQGEHPDGFGVAPTASNIGEDLEPMFSDHGFNLAKAYYEKLIIEHPYRRSQSNAIRSNFYPALFSCWIYQVTERSRLSKLRAKMDQLNDAGYEFSGSEREHSLSTRRADPGLTRRLHLIRERELEDAQAIAGRFDLIIDSPPHDKNRELLRLRGMVSQWIAHLLDSSVASDEDSSENEEDDDPKSNAMYARTAEEMGREEERQGHLERAEDMLSRAQMGNPRPGYDT